MTTSWSQLQQDADYLGKNLDVLAERDQSFASSLLEQFHDRGLSQKQEYWVGVLAARAVEGVRRRAAEREVKAVAAKPVIDLTRIVELFRTASTNLKKPFIWVQRLDDSGRIKLKLAGPSSRYAGQVYVYSADRFEERVWLGRVDPGNKAYIPSREVTSTEAQEIERTLVAFAADPVASAVKFGRTVGACCFCGRQLNDPRSVTVGYGPICADHFGLPWGEVVEVQDFKPEPTKLEERLSMSYAGRRALEAPRQGPRERTPFDDEIPF